MRETIRLIHQTTNRARYFLAPLKQEGINISSLENKLLSIKGVNDVRINKKASSVIFEHNAVELSTLEKALLSLELDTLATDDTCMANDISCVGDEKPSKAGMIRATSALLAEPFISNDTSKFAITAFASYPMLTSGIKQLYTEGLTSGVLEAMAVGVSLARKDYMAANGTNAMLELGEYIEETTVHKSDDLIRELAKPNVKEAWVEVDNKGKKDDFMEILLVDPQTSGGLLIAAPPEASELILKKLNESNYPFPCNDIGEITEGDAGMINLTT